MTAAPEAGREGMDRRPDGRDGQEHRRDRRPSGRRIEQETRAEARSANKFDDGT